MDTTEISYDSTGTEEQTIPGCRAGGESSLNINVPKDMKLSIHPQDLTVFCVPVRIPSGLKK